MRVALIDNDGDLGELFLEVCKGLSIDGVHIDSGAEAVFQLLRHHADVTIVDLAMPDMAGTSVIRHVRRNEKTFQVEPTRIIVYTGYDIDSEIGIQVKKMLSREEIESVVSKSTDLVTLMNDLVDDHLPKLEVPLKY